MKALTGFMLSLIVFTGHLASAYELSDLNGNWISNWQGYTLYVTLGGLPHGSTKLGKKYVASMDATISGGGSISAYCKISQLAANKFESRCYGNGANDHTSIRFLDQNTFEEVDLQNGLGTFIMRRAN